MKNHTWTFPGSYLPRVGRMNRHIGQGIRRLFRAAVQGQLSWSRLLRWWTDLLFFLLDLLVLPDLYDLAMGWMKWNTRSLSNDELQIARKIYGDSIAYERVKVDERAFIACRQYRICYVSFFTINLWGSISPGLLIHELMHVWQYMKMGAVYIPQALLAQRTQDGYDYGGIEGLSRVVKRGGGLDDFNLEQQAEIMADYYCLLNSTLPAWCEPEPAYLPVFEYFVSEVRGRGEGPTGWASG